MQLQSGWSEGEFLWPQRGTKMHEEFCGSSWRCAIQCARCSRLEFRLQAVRAPNRVNAELRTIEPAGSRTMSRCARRVRDRRRNCTRRKHPAGGERICCQLPARLLGWPQFESDEFSSMNVSSMNGRNQLLRVRPREAKAGRRGPGSRRHAQNSRGSL